MGGSSKTKSQSTTSTTLPANQQANVDLLMQGAMDYYNSGGRQFFPGDTVANFDPYQLQGQDALMAYAGGSGQDFVNQAMASNQFFMDPNNIMNPDNIPGFNASADAATARLTENLTRNILPSLRGQDTMTGQFGAIGSPLAGQEGIAVRENQSAVGDMLANMYLGAYGQGLNSFNQAMNRSPQMFALGAQPGTVMQNVGGQRQLQDQREIEGERERFAFEQNEPAVLLALLQQLTGGAGQYGGTTETVGQKSGGGNSPFNMGLGTLLTLGGMGGFGGGAGKNAGTNSFSGWTSPTI